MTPTVTRLADYKPYPFTVASCVEMVVELHHEVTRIKGAYTLAPKPEFPKSALVLNVKDLTIEALHINGKPTAFTIEGECLRVEQVPESAFEVRVVCTSRTEANTSCAGIYPSQNEDEQGRKIVPDMLSTQCEAEDFRQILPYPDRPDLLAEFKVRLEADKANFPVLLSNGNPVESGDLPEGRHYAVWHDPHKKPAYLFAIVAGKIVPAEQRIFTTMSGRKVAVNIWTRANERDAVNFAAEAILRAMKWDEDKYGREYDLDVFNIVAVADFNMGAMENKGLNIYNSKLLIARPEHATDEEYIRIDRVLAHEYFHNWSGNRVTCRDWFQLSLKEGFTVYRENHYGKDMFNPVVQRIHEAKELLGGQFVEDASTMSHPVQPKEYQEINNFYTATVYEKGGEVIGLYRTLMGDAKFREGTDLYFSRHDGEAATIEDFLKCMEEVSGLDLGGQFRLWYDQKGTPVVSSSGYYDTDKRAYVLTLTQDIPYGGKPMFIPVSAALVASNGQDAEGSTQVLHLTKASQTFEIKCNDAMAVPSLLRGFSAPVKFRTHLDEKQLRFLALSDSDGYNQWQAVQTLMTLAIGRALDAHRAGKPMPQEPELVNIIGSVIDSLREAQPGLLAEMLKLPDDDAIIGQFAPVEPQGVMAAQNHVGHAIGSGLFEKLEALHAACAPSSADFKFDEANISRRALRNAALALLVSGDEAKGSLIAKAQYDTAPTMTERAGAMRAVNDCDCPARDAMIADYYARFKALPLVMDRWFAIQATAKLPRALGDIKSLIQHPDFNRKNPNRARSLLGGFTFGANLAALHHPSGDGYMLLAEQIVLQDAVNPQSAARMLTPFKSIRNFDAAYQEKAKAALKHILEAEGERSKGVLEIVHAALGVQDGGNHRKIDVA